MVDLSSREIIRKLTEYFMPVIEQENYELYDLEFVKEGPNWYLRVYIDKDGGVTIDDCETVSRAVEKILDEKDPIQQGYILEVSSPGADRPLRKPADFEKYKGHLVDIKLYKNMDGKKQYQGKLNGLNGEILSIIDENGVEINFTKSDVAICRLAVVF